MSEKESIYEQIGVAMTCRSYDEYVRMFALDEARKTGPVLDVAGGASSFVATAREQGIEAAAADPLYRLSAADIAAHGAAEIESSTCKLAAIADKFDWSYYGGINRHRNSRVQSLERFARDYALADAASVYYPASLPQLPFADGSFALVLCSHFLFLYAEQFGYAFHRDAIFEMVRVCRPGGELRIYPLLDLHWNPYPQLPALMEELRRSGADAALLDSRLPFIPGSKKLLVIRPGAQL